MLCFKRAKVMSLVCYILNVNGYYSIIFYNNWKYYDSEMKK